jgi:hypothetical protein
MSKHQYIILAITMIHVISLSVLHGIPVYRWEIGGRNDLYTYIYIIYILYIYILIYRYNNIYGSVRGTGVCWKYRNNNGVLLFLIRWQNYAEIKF